MIYRRSFVASFLLGPLVPALAARWAQRDELTSLSLVDAAAGIERGDLSPVVLADAYLTRIARLNDGLNALVTVTAERARADARRWEAAGPSSARPLRGIPIAHKDLFETAGIRTTGGSRLFDGAPPARDAAVVALLARAGAVLVGKTNTHELGGGVTTINPFYGTTHNPVDPTRIPGGSSGGSAAAVAARLALAATGSDTGGSVRIPAALCGCVGFKPTFGRISTAGLLGACPTFDHAGLLTRTAADARRVFDVLAGPARRPARPGPLRVGVARPFFFEHLAPGVADAMAGATERLRAIGAVVSDRALPVDTQTMGRVFDPIVASEIWWRYGRDWATRPQAFSPAFAEFFRTAAPDPRDVSAARAALSTFQAEFDRVLADVDVILTPTVPVTAPPIAGPIDAALILRNTWPFNAARTPAISIPCGVDANGLPIGLQLAGRVGADASVLDAAERFERA